MRRFERSLTADQELIRRAKCGDRASLELLLTSERLDRIRRELRRNLSVDEVEDTHGEVVAQIYRSIRRFKGTNRRQFDAWVRAISRNVASGFVRSKIRDRERSISIDGRGIDPAVPDESGSFDSRTWLVWALGQIQPDFAETLLLSVRDGLTHREIADRMFISEATVGSRINRARRALKALEGGLDCE